MQEALVAEAFEAEEHGISGEGGEALIWRVGVSGGVEGKNLPQFLSSGVEEVGELIGTGAEVANPETSWQGGEMEQNAATARELHLATIRRFGEEGQGK
jgi:hypothetical protein